MLTIVLVLLQFVAAFVGSIVMGQIIHMYIHTKWAGPFHRSHMVHHLKAYPPGRLITDEYVSAGWNSTVYAFVCAAIPPVAIIITLCLLSVISVQTTIVIVVAMLLASYVHDVIHDSFHVRNHWVSRIAPRWYSDARHRHFVHHVNMRRNFGIVTAVFDRAFGTIHRSARRT